MHILDMDIYKILTAEVNDALNALYGKVFCGELSFQKTRKEFEGEVSLVVFQFLKLSGKNPVETASEIALYLETNSQAISKVQVVKGFLNFSLKASIWAAYFQSFQSDDLHAFAKPSSSGESIMIEYPSPNTNKPLHLGHLRNIFIGSSVKKILEACGHEVIHTCLYNDRGTNISKTILSWKKWGGGSTPESTGKKGDHFVGDLYVLFAKKFKEEQEELIKSGLSAEEANTRSAMLAEVNALTISWEEGNHEVMALWKMMNDWVYKGFETTFQALGMKPKKYYYESEVFQLGRETVQEGLQKGVFFKKADGSVWVDLKSENLEEKLILRSNGTSVYITQDIAIANEKEKDFKISRSLYVVGNEQDYHFKVLFLILSKLGRSYAEQLVHLSYGMVELPEGKMKSREGNVVDADEIIEEMERTAREATVQLGKTEGFSEKELTELYSILGMGALRFFILKVDPKKKMLFNPKESIDFNGHTGPFIQYTHARIQSILRKSGKSVEEIKVWEKGSSYILQKAEIELIQQLGEFPEVIREAAVGYSPALISNYVYELSKAFNYFYHALSVLSAEGEEQKNFRLALTYACGRTIRQGMDLLCIVVPDRM